MGYLQSFTSLEVKTPACHTPSVSNLFSSKTKHGPYGEIHRERLATAVYSSHLHETLNPNVFSVTTEEKGLLNET